MDTETFAFAVWSVIGLIVAVAIAVEVVRFGLFLAHWITTRKWRDE